MLILFTLTARMPPYYRAGCNGFKLTLDACCLWVVLSSAALTSVRGFVLFAFRRSHSSTRVAVAVASPGPAILRAHGRVCSGDGRWSAVRGDRWRRCVGTVCVDCLPKPPSR